MLDGSDSIPPLAYQKAVDYVIKEIETVTSLFPGSDVGVLIFSKVVEKEFELRQRSQSDLNQLYQSIRATKQPRKGSLLTGLSFLLFSKTYFLQESNCRRHLCSYARACVLER